MHTACTSGAMGGAALAICLLLLVAGGVVAQQAGEARRSGYSLSWWTVDGGGTLAAVPGCSLAGTAGQPDAGVLSGPGYRLAGGF